MIQNTQHFNMLISPARSVKGRVEYYEGSTLSQTFSHSDALSSFTLSRAGDKKFFGFGICQELELKLIDKNRVINIVENNILKVSFGVNGDYVYPAPPFIVSTDIQRNENTNEITVKAYDATYQAKSHTVSSLGLVAPYTIDAVANAIAAKLGLTAVVKINVNDTSFDTSYSKGANFDGSESLRLILDNIAEATQTIYYIDSNNNLVFKRLAKDANPVIEIRKADYFTFGSKTSFILSDICQATELGDNVITGIEGITGETQYVRDNPFWDLREDITTLLESAVGAIGGLTITPFNCKWRGNYLIEPGDKISIVAKDDNPIISYLLDEKYTYNGGLNAETAWEYNKNTGESADNPASLGDKLKQTFAKVDKVNKQIDIVVSDTEANKEAISSLQMNTNTISASVSDIRKTVAESVDGMNSEIAEISKKVNAQMTPEQVQLQINNSLDNGVHKVETTTGFTFNDEGLKITKSGTEMSTLITEDGMQVYRDNTAVLTANNLGVDAVNLHATTYLIIGTYSRLEDWEGRTGCFWIGG